MTTSVLARWRNSWKRFPFLPFSEVLGVVAVLCLTGVPAHAQAAGEYGAGAGVSAGVVTSKPQVYTPGGPGKPNMSRVLAKPTGPPPGQLNREWFARQAGKNGGQLSIDAVPAQTGVWIDGKFVGQAPLTFTLPAGKHHVSFMGPRQEQADREVDIAAGKKQHLSIHLEATYPATVSIPVFGHNSH